MRGCLSFASSLIFLRRCLNYIDSFRLEEVVVEADVEVWEAVVVKVVEGHLV